MGRLLALSVLAVLASAGAAFGQGATNPTYTREQQGATIDQIRVSCDTTSTMLYTSAASQDLRSVTLTNEGANPVYLCVDNRTGAAPTPTPVACTTTTAVTVLQATEGVVLDKSVRGIRLQCITTGGASLVYGFAERG